ncbi:MAG: phosphoadenosine phosphosulfate reductase family protein [Bacteroidaceae bacterium]|nr:phosphoadenosine phosphosulfate reductase family protein [Bacteroidaceae bacterium]
MIKKSYSNIDVVTAARQRIKNIFNTAPAVQLSISGGKDSIVLNDLIFKMCQSGEIDKSKLVIDFIDEEAIYPCVEKTVRHLRTQWMMLGVEFRWWCIEVKHFNCLNQLTNDESFFCWDRYKKDVWIRPMPSFAITDHPLLRKRKDSYQMFLPRLNSGRVQLIGVRCSESMQRLGVVSAAKAQNNQYPIYDWLDVDVWRYILDNNLEFPDAYLYMYQVGIPINRLRISQFFSVDTVKSLVQMCEFYPELFDKICKREPNAYMAMLYFDTELFRRQKKNKQASEDEDIDYKAKVFELLNDPTRFTTASQIKNRDTYQRMICLHGVLITNTMYKEIYNALVGGDPKNRSYRAIISNLFRDTRKLEDVK